MDRDEAIRLLRGGPGGVREWNERRVRGEDIPDLSGVDLSEVDLRKVDLHRADLRGASLHGAHFLDADLSEVDLREANLRGADLRGADLRGADLRGADLGGVDLFNAHLDNAYLDGVILNGAVLSGAVLSGAVLDDADLRGAYLNDSVLVGTSLRYAALRGAILGDAVLRDARLVRTDLSGTDLRGADLSSALCGGTGFGNVDLSKVNGLESIRHEGPSTVGVDTLVRSRGRIPEAFLRGCGFTPWQVLEASLYRPDLTPAGLTELQYRIFDAWTMGRSLINGCFLSHSWKDSRFVDALRDRLMAEGVNVWLDRHDMVAGTIQDQLWRAIQFHHVVILVLSEDSVQSDWVENELDMARRKEKAEKRAVLCPISLDDAWKAKVGAEDGPGDAFRGLWRTMTGKFVVDFSGWEAGAFDGAFQRLLRGLKTNYRPAPSE